MIVGIDPGLSGAIAFLPENGHPIVYDMPVVSLSATRRAVSPVQVATLLADQGIDLAVIEDVGTNPTFGAQRAFTFGRDFGAILAVLELAGLPTLRVAPKVWKKAMLAGTDQSKEAAVARVNQLYPDLKLKKTEHDKAEALLMALYGREKQR